MFFKFNMIKFRQINCRRKLYSKESNYLLNNLTLKIKDKEIKKSHYLRTAENFNKLFWPWAVTLPLSLIIHTSNYIFGRGALFLVIIGVGQVFIWLFWLIFRRKWNIFWNRLTLCIMILQEIITLLFYYDFLGP